MTLGNINAEPAISLGSRTQKLQLSSWKVSTGEVILNCSWGVILVGGRASNAQCNLDHLGRERVDFRGRIFPNLSLCTMETTVSNKIDCMYSLHVFALR